MPMSAAKKARESSLPKSATITIQNREPHPSGKVEVTPDGGRIHFHNKDKDECRLRVWRLKTDSANHGLDVLIPAGGRFTVLIRKDDQFDYSVMDIHVIDAMNGHGGGPITN